MDPYTASEEAYKRGLEAGRKEGCGKCAECRFAETRLKYPRDDLVCIHKDVPLHYTVPDFGCILFERKEKGAHEG